MLNDISIFGLIFNLMIGTVDDFAARCWSWSDDRCVRKPSHELLRCVFLVAERLGFIVQVENVNIIFLFIRQMMIIDDLIDERHNNCVSSVQTIRELS